MVTAVMTKKLSAITLVIFDFYFDSFVVQWLWFATNIKSAELSIGLGYGFRRVLFQMYE